MNYLQKIIGLLLVVTVFTACSFQTNEVKENPYGIRAYSQGEMDSILDNHPFTIIYTWDPGCVFCEKYLQEDVIPYLSVKPDTIGFISITSSNYSRVFHFFEKHDWKVPTFLYKDTTNSHYNFYRDLFPSILKNYEHPQSDGVPRTIVCNNKREILNICDEPSYDANGDIIPGIHYEGIHWIIEDLDKIINK